MKKYLIPMSFVVLGLFTACDSDDDNTDYDGSTINNPTTYSFERNGESTVDFNGQSTRLAMGGELGVELKNTSKTSAALLAMFAHQEGESNFSNAALNASNKNIRSKTAASVDYFSTNATDQALIRADFDKWINQQVEEVFPNWNSPASVGVAGQIADGSSTRYINALGLEYDQLVIKGLIGALVIDQTLNNYLSPAVLDEGNNRTDNDMMSVEDGKTYTTMEHKWDEAYGYVYGLNADPANPNADLGADSFLNKYIGRVEGDSDFAGIAKTIFDAFKLGRAAIVARDYNLRDAQAEILKKKISEIVGIRAVYYLQQAKPLLAQEVPAYGSAFHDLSEGYGFIYSLQFTRNPLSNAPYFTKAEVDAFLLDLMDDGPNGLWDVKAATLDAISVAIAERFEFTLEAAAE
ncbi:hypothetical protein SB49_07180 [Sediminicola sp. YIK13]|uniref:DUF4856 domain-containing protein n=1 Tax=Sediminicola sp. YIK13 TaxID=1453352 RepID=UPI000721F87D|nr:DUF4856 domain-containing protein [Sediminicola sp. YIK13]ALM07608.1 hypothetical protein SB49_07180 [Sediminicola sp. YIK13]